MAAEPRPTARPLSFPARVLFAPAVAVMNRLSYARKFLLISVLVSGPLGVVVSLLVSTASERVGFNARERLGITYVAPAYELLVAVERHRVLAAAERAGGPGVTAQREVASRAVDDTMARLQQVDRRIGATLRTSAPLAGIALRWGALRGAPSLEEPSEGAHAALGRELAALVLHHAGNHSNLILDPGLDSYWLADALVVRLPALAEAVAELGAVGLRGAGARQPFHTMELAALHREALTTSAALGRNLQTVYDEAAQAGRGAALRERIDGPERDAIAAVQAQSVALSAPLLEGLVAPPDGARLLAHTLHALDRLQALHAALAPELDALVEARLERASRQRSQGLLAAGMAGLVLAYLFVGFYLSVQASLLAVGRAELRGAARPSEERVFPPLSDELGQLAAAYVRALGEKDLLHEQLLQAAQLATIGRLAAGTAHELNEPLGAILGFGQLALKDAALGAQTRADITKITRAALHAREVIRKLLLFARQTVPQKAQLDLNDLVEECVEFLSVQAEHDGVRLELALDEQLPTLVADQAQVRQVVLNLAVNAMHATAPGGAVRITTAVAEQHLVLVVDDHGVGMSEESMENIFLPFFTTKDVGRGTGLGLSVVHGIVSAHGGAIRVESKLGQGTRFEVRWPKLLEGEPSPVGG